MMEDPSLNTHPGVQFSTQGPDLFFSVFQFHPYYGYLHRIPCSICQEHMVHLQEVQKHPELLAASTLLHSFGFEDGMAEGLRLGNRKAESVINFLDEELQKARWELSLLKSQVVGAAPLDSGLNPSHSSIQASPITSYQDTLSSKSPGGLFPYHTFNPFPVDVSNSNKAKNQGQHEPVQPKPHVPDNHTPHQKPSVPSAPWGTAAATTHRPSGMPNPTLEDPVWTWYKYYSINLASWPWGVRKDLHGGPMLSDLRADRAVARMCPGNDYPQKAKDGGNNVLDSHDSPRPQPPKPLFKSLIAELFSTPGLYKERIDRMHLEIAKEVVYQPFDLQSLTIDTIVQHIARCGVSAQMAVEDFEPWSNNYLKGMNHSVAPVKVSKRVPAEPRSMGRYGTKCNRV